MRKVILTICFIVFVFLQIIQAQVGTYSFASSSGTYTEITGGTMLINGTVSMDSWVSSAITIPSFPFNGVAYTTAYISSNGFITLGGNAPSAYTTTAISSNVGSGIAICPFSVNLKEANTTTASEMRWETVGNEVVFQWKGMTRNSLIENFDFQVRLNTVTGTVSFVYNLNTGPASGTTYPQVGLRTSSSDFNNRYVSNTGAENWATSLAGTANTNTCRFTSAAPQKNFTSGLTYTWTPPSCSPPNNLVFSNLTSNSANFSWTAPILGSPNSYEWKVVLSGAGSGGTAESSGTVTHPNVSDIANGLSASIAYHLFIRTFCGGTDYSTWAGPFAFTTLCADQTILTENFDAVTTPALPTCWAKVGTSGSVSTQTSNNFSTPNCLYMYSSGSSSVAVVSMPPLSNAGANTHCLKFKARASSSAGAVLEVGYLTNPSNAASFVLLDSKTLSLTYTDYIIYPGTAPGANKVLAFRASYNPAYSSLIDNVSWEPMPSCPGTNFLSVGSITTTSASLNWNEVGTASNWKIQWGPSGFVLGDGAMILTTIKPYILSPLSSNTSYDFYIQSNCGGVDTSTWVGPYTFTTLCPSITIFPFSESFDGTTFAPSCWTNVKIAGTGTGLWDRQTEGTYPICTTHSGLGMGRFNSYSYSDGTKGILVTPPLILPNSNYQVRFWMYRDDAYLTKADLVNVYYNTINNLTAATLIGTIYRTSSMPPVVSANGWYEYVFNVPAGISGSSYFVFEGVSAYGNNIFIDDVTIDVIPTCPGLYPTSITASNPTLNSIDLAWLEPGTATQWQIEYGATGFTHGNGMYAIANTQPFNLGGLNAGTIYQAYIRSICTPGDTSSWKGPVSFVTLCNPTSATMIQNFDNVTVPDLPVCWSKIVTSTSSLAYVRTLTTNTPFSAPNHVVMTNSPTAGATTYLMLVTPELTDLASGNKRLRFMAKRGTTAEDLIIGTLSNPNDGSTFTPLSTINLTNIYNEYLIPFTYSGTDDYIAFKHANTTTGTYIYLDNINWEPNPTCIGVTFNSLTASNATTTSIDLAWTEGGTAVQWQIEYGFAGFIHGAGTYIIANNNTHTISGLQHSKAYEVYVRSICAAGDTSLWRGPVAFNTLCGVNTVFPYTENFATTTFPPLCWTMWSGLLAAPSTLTTTTSGWGSDDYLNITTPVNKSSRINIWGSSVKYWLVTPSINLGSTVDYLLSFDLALTKYNLSTVPDLNGTDDKFAVVISTDDGATWTSANTLRLWDNAGSAYVYNNISLTGQNIKLDLSSFTGTVKIGFYGESITSNADNDLFVDNVTVYEKPACSEPTLSVVNVDDTTAIIAWNGGGVSTVGYQIEWGVVGFTQGTGTIISTNLLSDTLTGLIAGTTYEFYVRTVCLYNDTSDWSDSYQFTTLPCPIVDMCAYTLVLKDQYSDSWNGAEILVRQNGLEIGTYTLANGLASSTQVIDLCNGANVEFIWNDGSYDEECALTIKDHLGLVLFNFTFTNAPADSDTFFVSTVDCSIPTCMFPSNLISFNEGQTSIDLGWTAGGTDTLWQIEYDTTGFSLGTGTLIVTDDNPYSLTGLAEGTVYDFYVRAICDTVTGDTSIWMGPYSFITSCGIVDVYPWNDIFDNAAPPDIFPCWDKNTAGGCETWYVETYQPQFGTQYVGINYDASNQQHEYLISPAFDFSFLVHPYISFWWNMSYTWAVSPNDNYNVYLLASTDDGVTLDTLWSETDAGVFTNWTWYETMIDLSAYAAEPNLKLAFNYVGLDGAALYLDNVTVDDTTTVGLKPIPGDLNVNIYPNPNNGLFNIQMLCNAETLTLTILNIQGQVVYEEQLSGVAYGSNTELNLRSLAAGMYHIKLTDGKTIINKKLIIN